MIADPLLREDGVALAGFFAVSRSSPSSPRRNGFVLTAEDGVVLGNGVAGNCVYPRAYCVVNALNDGCLVNLLRLYGGRCEQCQTWK